MTGSISVFTINVSNMRNSGLTPVAIKESATRKTFTLIDHGYTQGKEIIKCVQCGMRFLLLFDAKKRAGHHSSPDACGQMIKYFSDEILKDHDLGHSHDRFVILNTTSGV
jgi:hypothetical protein